jgi:endoglucanase
MKTLNIFYSFILICITFVGCSKDEVNILTITPQQVNISANGGSGSITLKTDAKSWTIANSASDWLNVSSTSGNIKDATISLTVTTRTLAPRSATVTVSAGDAKPVLVTVSQPSSEFLYSFTTGSALQFKQAGETQLLEIETTSPQWSLSADADWLQFDKSSGLGGTKTISITALANSSVTRAATISITSENAQTVQVQVQQAGDIYPSYNTSPTEPDATGMSSNAVELAAKIKLGWNLGNALEATSGTLGNETLWGNPLTTKALIDVVKASGFNAVRLPCSWNGYLANQATAEIKLSWLNRVKEVVQYCVDNDMYVLLNIHWDGGWLDGNINAEKKDETRAKQKALWEQIATTMRDFDEHVMFASANEPPVNNPGEMSILLSYHQAFVDAVRSTGGRNSHRVLVIQGPSTDIEKTVTLMNAMPTDQVEGRMMAEVHYYGPWQFCGLTDDADWGTMFYYWGNGYHSTTDLTRNPSWDSEEEYMTAEFQKVKTKFVDKGIPVVLGEYGAIRRTEDLTGDALTLHLASRTYWHKYATQQAIAHGMLPFYWDNGYLSNEQFGIFNRQNNTVGDQQVLDALVEGSK